MKRPLAVFLGLLVVASLAMAQKHERWSDEWKSDVLRVVEELRSESDAIPKIENGKAENGEIHAIVWMRDAAWDVLNAEQREQRAMLLADYCAIKRGDRETQIIIKDSATGRNIAEVRPDGHFEDHSIFTINKDGLAEWQAPVGATLDAVWTGTLKVLMGMKWAVVISDKTNGTLTAREAHTTFANFGKSPQNMPHADFLFTESDGRVSALVRWYVGSGSGLGANGGWGWGSAKANFYRDFFTRLTDALK